MQFYVNDKKVFAPSAETRSKLAATLVNLRTIYTECMGRFVGNGYYVVQVVAQTHTATIDKNSTHIVSVKKNITLWWRGSSVVLSMNGEPDRLSVTKTRMIDECANMLNGEVVIRVWHLDKNEQLTVYKLWEVDEYRKVLVEDEALTKKARRYYESEKAPQSLAQFCAAALKVPVQIPKYRLRFVDVVKKPTCAVTYCLPKGQNTYVQAEYNPELHEAAMQLVPPKVDLLVGTVEGAFGVYEPTFASIVPELARVGVLWLEQPDLHTKLCYVQAGNGPAADFDLEHWNKMVSALRILKDEMSNTRVPMWLSSDYYSVLNDFADRGSSIGLLCNDCDKINAILEDFREAFPKHANFSTDVFAVCDLDERDYVRARERGSVIVTDNTRRYTDMPGVVHTPKFFAALRNVKKR